MVNIGGHQMEREDATAVVFPALFDWPAENVQHTYNSSIKLVKQ